MDKALDKNQMLLCFKIVPQTYELSMQSLYHQCF